MHPPRTRPTVPRRLRAAAAGALGLALAGTGCTSAPPGPPAGAPTVEGMAASLGRDVVSHLARGYVPGRSGEIVLVPRPRNVVVRRGAWDPGGEPGADTSHATPWDYHQRVPIVLYGPGYVRAGLRSARPVDVADLAPTVARLLGFGLPARPDGRPLGEALVPRGPREPPPRLVVVVVYDGGGWNLLRQWPEAWPVVRSLAARGTVYTNATVGSSPSVTAPVHATIGTGVYPRRHGIPDNTARLPGGEVGDALLGRSDPGLLRVETLAEAWDRRNGDRPWVGLLATEPWHLGLLGRGAAAGGDRDVAVLWNRQARRFFTNERLFSLPASLPGPERLDRHLARLDASDGLRDGRWLDNDLGDPGVVPGTPAFVAYQGDAVLEVVRREPVGRDGLTDLLFVELKSTDRGAHVWNLLGEEEEAVLRAQDALVGRLVGLLDEAVGAGRYVLALTADHGLTPLPERAGGVRVHPDAVGEAVDAHFGRSLVEAVTPAALFLDVEALEAAGVGLWDVARFVGDLRLRDAVPEGTDLGGAPPGAEDERVFAAALPGPYLAGLTEAEIRGLGAGRYPEGDLTTPPPVEDLLDG